MAGKKSKFYAVRSGREPGIYRTWDECKAQVDGYAKAEYKSFSSLQEAEAYLNGATTPRRASKSAPEVESDPLPAQGSLLGDPESDADLERVVIYTDGSCLQNPGRGGYGAVMLYDGQRKELSGGFRLTTNNRMEILACIVALQSLNTRRAVTLYSDSQYVVNSIEKGWAKGWRKNRWMRKDVEVPNADLWRRLLDLCEEHDVSFKWVRGHAGNKENERCDYLARQGAMSDQPVVDTVYERKQGLIGS
ncbi:MAG: ribonuclease HI [Blastocatellia bacterium]